MADKRFKNTANLAYTQNAATDITAVHQADTEENVYAQINLKQEKWSEQLERNLKEVSNCKKLTCGRFVTILVLVLTILLLIAAFAMVGHSLVRVITQQSRLSSQGSNINTLQSQLNNSTQLIMTLQAQQISLNDDTNSLQAQLDNSTQLITTLQSQLNKAKERIQMLQNSTDIEVLDQSLFLLENRRSPASSCSDIPQNRPSGEYWILSSTGSPVQVYCDMNRTSCSCNTTGGWMRIANLDMTNSNQNCPDGFRLVNRTEPPLHTCGRPGNGFTGCVSTTYQTHGVEYSHVCGRVIGYQSGSTSAFSTPRAGNIVTTIDSLYIEGISLTHGQSPRQHIWSFAAALSERVVDSFPSRCPCIRPNLPDNTPLPPFVGQDYFCATGNRNTPTSGVFFDDPLWDGQGCGGTSTCCQFNNPPWFCRQLPQPTTDDIELRLCADEDISNEDSPIERVEVYIR